MQLSDLGFALRFLEPGEVYETQKKTWPCRLILNRYAEHKSRTGLCTLATALPPQTTEICLDVARDNTCCGVTSSHLLQDYLERLIHIQRPKKK